jgi:subtilisin family serine protease
MLKHSALVLTMCSAFTAFAQTHYVWQHSDVRSAWQQGYKGQGATIHIHDDFVGSRVNAISGARNAWESIWWRNTETMTHGEAVATVASRTAPLAHIESRQWVNNNLQLQAGRLNIVNASYAIGGNIIFSQASVDSFRNSNQLAQIAHQGSALVVKAAGNRNLALSNNGGGGDILNMALKGSDTVIFAGALDDHGTQILTHRVWRWTVTTGGTHKASYSNMPGSDPDYYNNFLMVGVPRNMSVAGTSFAAPQISAYAAIVGSKFSSATPQSVATQLLTTARRDTIHGYHPHVHGRGEASLSRALAPARIQ